MDGLWNWLRDGAIALMPFAVIWLMRRTEQLGRQIQACMHLIQLEVARHDEERERELLAEWKEEREQQRKDNRMALLAWGTLGAIVAVGWFFWGR